MSSVSNAACVLMYQVTLEGVSGFIIGRTLIAKKIVIRSSFMPDWQISLQLCLLHLSSMFQSITIDLNQTVHSSKLWNLDLTSEVECWLTKCGKRSVRVDLSWHWNWNFSETAFSNLFVNVRNDGDIYLTFFGWNKNWLHSLDRIVHGLNFQKRSIVVLNVSTSKLNILWSIRFVFSITSPWRGFPSFLIALWMLLVVFRANYLYATFTRNIALRLRLLFCECVFHKFSTLRRCFCKVFHGTYGTFFLLTILQHCESSSQITHSSLFIDGRIDSFTFLNLCNWKTFSRFCCIFQKWSSEALCAKIVSLSPKKVFHYQFNFSEVQQFILCVGWFNRCPLLVYRFSSIVLFKWIRFVSSRNFNSIARVSY